MINDCDYLINQQGISFNSFLINFNLKFRFKNAVNFGEKLSIIAKMMEGKTLVLFTTKKAVNAMELIVMKKIVRDE